MTEQEWLKCDDIDMMMAIVGRDDNKRRYYLFSCACCRLLEYKLPPKRRDVISIIESFADGIATTAQVQKMRDHVHGDMVGNRAYPYAFWHLVNIDMEPWQTAAQVWWHVIDGRHDRRPKLAVIQNMFRDIFNPYWQKTSLPINDTIRNLALTAYTSGDYKIMPIISDALEDAGCTDQKVLEHCRDYAYHARGCWVLDEILDKR